MAVAEDRPRPRRGTGGPAAAPDRCAHRCRAPSPVAPRRAPPPAPGAGGSPRSLLPSTGVHRRLDRRGQRARPASTTSPAWSTTSAASAMDHTSAGMRPMVAAVRCVSESTRTLHLPSVRVHDLSMRHAGPAALDELEPLLVALRDLTESEGEEPRHLLPREPSVPALPRGPVRPPRRRSPDRRFERFRVQTKAEQRAVLTKVRRSAGRLRPTVGRRPVRSSCGTPPGRSRSRSTSPRSRPSASASATISTLGRSP